MAVVLALVSAVAYGVSDFLGGIFTKTISPWRVATFGQLSSTLCAIALAPFVTGASSPADLAWAVLAGLGSGLGAAFLYRGLATARMSVVAPVSAIGAALLPVVIGLSAGDRPGLAAVAGIIVAFPAIWLISRVAEDDVAHRGGLLDGTLAGIGFGVLFVAVGQVGDDAGLWPIVLMYTISAVTVAGVALVLGHSLRPRALSDLRPMMLGPIGMSALVAFWVATHHGLLSIVAIIASLYPASTVVLAALVLHERIHRHQGIGLLLAAVAVSLVALA